MDNNRDLNEENRRFGNYDIGTVGTFDQNIFGGHNILGIHVNGKIIPNSVGWNGLQTGNWHGNEWGQSNGNNLGSWNGNNHHN